MDRGDDDSLANLLLFGTTFLRGPYDDVVSKADQERTRIPGRDEQGVERRIDAMQLAPAAQIADRMNPYGTEPTVTRNFGDIRKMLNDLGVNWVPARIAWDAFNPHPDMANLPRETVFVGPGNGNSHAFNPRHPAAMGLQELLLLYPGQLTAADESNFIFDPLVQTGAVSGYSSFFDVVRPGAQGLAINPAPPHIPAQTPTVLAAQSRARAVDPSTGRATSNVIVVADLDLISDAFFDIRAAAPVNANFDNITFFLNAIDYLAGDERSITLRSRRVRHRTLERVELQTRNFIEQRTRDEGQAERDAREALGAARERLSGRVNELKGRRDLDDQARQTMDSGSGGGGRTAGCDLARGHRDERNSAASGLQIPWARRFVDVVPDAGVSDAGFPRFLECVVNAGHLEIPGVIVRQGEEIEPESLEPADCPWWRQPSSVRPRFRDTFIRFSRLRDNRFKIREYDVTLEKCRNDGQCIGGSDSQV